jgi:hypothetical protein
MEPNVKFVSPDNFLRKQSLLSIGYEASCGPGKISLPHIGNQTPAVKPITSHLTHEDFDIKDGSFLHVIQFHPSWSNSTL